MERVSQLARRVAVEFIGLTGSERESLIERAILEAVSAERERCAAICEGVNNHDNPMTANDCASAIRAGGGRG